MKRFGRLLLRIVVALAIVALATLIAGVLVVRSGWFQERVRERIIAALESTGGRAEIASFTFDWEHLRANISGLVLHGHEPGGNPALVAAKSVTVGLRVISPFERKIDLAYLRVEQPQIHLEFYPDGSNNLLIASGNWAQAILNISIARYEVDDGALDYDQRRIPLSIRGEHLRAQMTYDRRGPRYRGELESSALRAMTAGAAPLSLNVSAAFAIDSGGIDVTSLRLSTKDSRAEISGRLNDPRNPHGTLRVRGTAALREAVEMFALPIAKTGSAAFDGQLAFSFTDVSIAGRLSARGIGYARDRLKIDNADFSGDVRLAHDRLSLAGINAHALGGTIGGAAELKDNREFHFDGNVAGLTVKQAAAIVTTHMISPRIPWDGAIAGGFTVDATLGEPNARVQTAIAITRLSDGAPIEGQINANYDQASNKLTLKNSWVTTHATRVEASGTLGETLDVQAQSTDLDDLLPALAIAENDAPKELPVKLTKGRATFRGRVSGSLSDPRATGEVALVNASVEGHAFDRFSAQISAARAGVQFDRATVVRGATELQGSASLAENSVAAQFNFRNAILAELAKEAGVNMAVTGTASGSVHLSGSPQQPAAEISIDVDKPAGFGEQFDRLRAKLRYSSEFIAISEGEATLGGGQFAFQGEYRHRAGDWKNGDASVGFTAQSIALSSIKAFANLESGVDAKIEGKAGGEVRIANGEIEIRAIDSAATARGLRWNRQSFGDIALSAETHGGDLSLHASAKVNDVSAQAQGSWKLTGDMPGSASVQLSRANLATVHSVLTSGGPLENTELPFEGFINGASASIEVALRKPRDFHAQLTAADIEIHPKPTQTLRLGVQAQDVALRSAKPVIVEISAGDARIRSAQFAARDTSLEATGAISFNAKNSSDLTVRGSVNLAILQLLNPDLAARGSATVQTAIRGSLRDPQVNGRMELKNASLYLGDLPNGVDNANGALIFDRNRATIETLTAETGGGKINFAGFIGFGSPLVYRLQATIEKVRVRYPEDVSVTFDAKLALNGTSDASTVSGLVTLTRAAFTPRADLARVLAQTATPLPAPASTDYIRGMQFDVRVESGPGFVLDTSLARNLEAEVDLRLRGTPLRPALLGTASVNEGEVQVFGNRYTVNRGDIRFVNAVKIDPIFDMELETKSRGVTVNISISGTLEKMNVNYSSDPPMQPREIIALLAVGRSPDDVAGLGSNQYSNASSNLSEAGGGLISEAITAQLSSRLQRFFGSSRVKIDPTPTGAEYLPQARLTFEQQVSNDITLTYITNLNRTEEQIVQIEYDFSRRWSALATREANGLFGIDFQYKRRFK
jgi:translocation and assembly module TamB